MAGDKKWSISFRDLSLNENDLTLEQCERIEKLTGQSWQNINPLRSAVHAKAIVTVMGAEATGEPEAVIAAEVGKLTAKWFLEEALSYVDDDVPTMFEDGNPPSAAAPSTRGSSTSRGPRSAGRQK